jgi:hypothetical protein
LFLDDGIVVIIAESQFIVVVALAQGLALLETLSPVLTAVPWEK